MYRKLFFASMILILLAIPISAQEKIIENEYIDPFRKQNSNIENTENNDKEDMGQIEVEVGMLNDASSKEIKDVLKFRGIIKYKDLNAVILELDGKRFLLNKNETFDYLEETYQLVSVDNELILFNQETFKELELVKNKEYGGVKYSVEIKE